MHLIDSDLRKNKYTIDELTKNVEYLSIKTLLRWQHLDADFCKKFILNPEYQSVEESYYVTNEYILSFQPHLSYDELVS